MSSSISRLVASNIDGRARTPRYIQNQLQALHSSLLKNGSEIRQAIASSSNYTPAEVRIEYYLTLSVVKDQYASIDFDQMMEEEYRIANGKDTADRRVAAGIVYIVPSSHTLFYSVIVPLSVVIAAGNCVVLELRPTLSEINSLLRKVLPQSLDEDTFTIVDSVPEDSNFLNSCIRVLPTPSTSPSPNALISPSTSRTIAIVDRSSDLETAASALITARFSFGGRSPYAPDLVLVNEFVIDEFSNLVVQQAAKMFSRKIPVNNPGEKSRKLLSEEELREQGTSVVVSGDSGAIVTVNDRESKLLQKKFSQPVLILTSISSLDDAIDFSNRGASPLLATYLFANPASAKYLSQFIDSYLSLVNQIPAELLVGPPTPVTYPASPSHLTRFNKTMFTVPRPAYITSQESASKQLNTILTSPLTGTSLTTISELEKEASKELKPTGQKPGNHIGFFEQGILTGLVLVFVPAAVGTLAAVGFGVRGLVRVARR